MRLETTSQWELRSSTTSFAHTLHELGVIGDEEYDRLVIEIYNRYMTYYSYVKGVNNED